MRSGREYARDFRAEGERGGDSGDLSTNLGWLETKSSRLIWVFVCAGIAVRLEQYFYNRSLWHDEAMMALNILHRSFSQLAQPLDFHLVGPLGWLFTEKICNVLLGNRELALRLPQILTGVAAMLLFPLLARRVLAARGAVVLAVGWFAFSRPLIYYSSELKPYGSDAAIALLLWLLGFWALDLKSSWFRIGVLAITGAAALWFSYPALFVLAGIALTIAAGCVAARAGRRFATLMPAFVVWAGSFALNYALVLRNASHDPGLGNSYPFARLAAHFRDVEAMLESIFVLQQNPITLLLGVAVLAAAVGCLYFWRNNRTALGLLLSPILLGLAASGRHQYPLMGRFFIFSAPVVAILIGAGAEQFRLVTRSSALPLGAALIVLLFFQPVFSTAEIVVHPIQTTELRPVLRYVREHQRTGDVWYVYCYGRFTFEYYVETYGMDSDNVVIGSCFANFRNSVSRDVLSGTAAIAEPLLASHPGWRWLRTGNLRYNWEFAEQDFAQLRGHRVWVIFAQIQTADGVDERALSLHVLDSLGRQVESHAEPGSVAYLYDLTGTPGVISSAISF